MGTGMSSNSEENNGDVGRTRMRMCVALDNLYWNPRYYYVNMCKDRYLIERKELFVSRMEEGG